MENSKRLFRSNTDKVIGGVSGGLAKYLDVDPVLIRVAFVLLTLFGGGGVLIYIVMWIAIPAETIDYKAAFEGSTTTVKEDPPEKKTMHNSQSNTALIMGVLLIIVGLLFLADRLMPFYSVIDFWPVILIVLGVLIIKPDLFKSSAVKSNSESTDESTSAEIVEPKNIKS